MQLKSVTSTVYFRHTTHITPLHTTPHHTPPHTTSGTVQGIGTLMLSTAESAISSSMMSLAKRMASVSGSICPPSPMLRTRWLNNKQRQPVYFTLQFPPTPTPPTHAQRSTTSTCQRVREVARAHPFTKGLSNAHSSTPARNRVLSYFLGLWGKSAPTTTTTERGCM